MAAGLAAAAAAVVRRARGCRVGLPAARNFSFYTRDAADILLRGTCGGLVTMQLFQPPSAVWGARSHFIIAPRSFCCGKPCGLFPMNACGLARPAEYQLGRPAEVVPFEITEVGAAGPRRPAAAGGPLEPASRPAALLALRGARAGGVCRQRGLRREVSPYAESRVGGRRHLCQQCCCHRHYCHCIPLDPQTRRPMLRAGRAGR